jgi:hypothetical protein
MKKLARSIILTLSLAFAAPACLVTPVEPTDSYAITVRSERRCHPSRYWNGHRCVKKRYSHHHHHRWHR